VVCGGKPGGAAAYTLKESCVLKGSQKKDRTKTVIPANSDKQFEIIKKNMKNVADDLKKVLARINELKGIVIAGSQEVPQVGTDHILIRDFVLDAKNSSNASVHARVKKACEAYNQRARGGSRVVFNGVLERLVLSGVKVFYRTLMRSIIDQ
jgi:hypothetical protein